MSTECDYESMGESINYLKNNFEKFEDYEQAEYVVESAEFYEFVKIFKKEFKELLKPHVRRIKISPSRPKRYGWKFFIEIDLQLITKNNDRRFVKLELEDLNKHEEAYIFLKFVKHFGAEDETWCGDQSLMLDENFKDNLFRILRIERL